MLSATLPNAQRASLLCHPCCGQAAVLSIAAHWSSTGQAPVKDKKPKETPVGDALPLSSASSDSVSKTYSDPLPKTPIVPLPKTLEDAARTTSNEQPSTILPSTAPTQDFAKTVKEALQGSFAAAVNIYGAVTSSSKHTLPRSTSRVHVVHVKVSELLGKTKQMVNFPEVSLALQQLNAVGPAALTQPILVKCDAFWQNYSTPIKFSLGMAATYGLWRLLDSGVVSVFGAGAVMDYATLIPSGVVVAWLMWYLQQRYVLDTSTVYQLAMNKLSNNAGVLEVMGYPLAGSSWRASLVTGGGWHWTGAGLRLRSKRVHLIFPVRGSERRGLVCLEAKKLAGKIRFKLLSIDVPVEGGEERVFVVGGENEYNRGDMFQELRTPFVKAVLLKQQFDAEDETDLTLDYIEGSARRSKQQASTEDAEEDAEEHAEAQGQEKQQEAMPEQQQPQTTRSAPPS